MGNCCKFVEGIRKVLNPSPQVQMVVRGIMQEEMFLRFISPRGPLSRASRYVGQRARNTGVWNYLYTDRESRELLACKSISKQKLNTAVDIEDVRQEVGIMKHFPKNNDMVSLKNNVVHLLMELYEGGDIFDRIVARGHYTERVAAAVTRTMVEVIQVSTPLEDYGFSCKCDRCRIGEVWSEKHNMNEEDIVPENEMEEDETEMQVQVEKM